MEFFFFVSFVELISDHDAPRELRSLDARGSSPLEGLSFQFAFQFARLPILLVSSLHLAPLTLHERRLLSQVWNGKAPEVHVYGHLGVFA